MNFLVRIFSLFQKWFDLSTYNVIGLYDECDNEVITMKKRIYIPDRLSADLSIADLVLIMRYKTHYNLFFLFSMKKLKINLHFPPAGHVMEIYNEFGLLVENPYEEGTPFKLAFHKLKLHKRVRRGLSFGNHMIHEGDKWPIEQIS
ncbi:MAG: hypothetical protein Solivirus5_14 [Solivirus sp.]|uniref:Uncharacterized protein n=1 Tax=Solivirus sp. TaxID=2487772 RepID=A0A3G5AFV6_9VIRU|nr:MAG: hypothetical protein Solivirus5_14 [Solivirus sp.]